MMGSGVWSQLVNPFHEGCCQYRVRWERLRRKLPFSVRGDGPIDAVASMLGADYDDFVGDVDLTKNARCSLSGILQSGMRHHHSGESAFLFRNISDALLDDRIQRRESWWVEATSNGRLSHVGSLDGCWNVGIGNRMST